MSPETGHIDDALLAASRPATERRSSDMCIFRREHFRVDVPYVSVNGASIACNLYSAAFISAREELVARMQGNGESNSISNVPGFSVQLRQRSKFRPIEVAS